MDTKPLQYSAVLERVKAFQAKQAAEDTNAVADPTNKGTASIPKDSDVTPAKLNLPANKANDVSNEGKKLEDKQLNPAGTGTDVPTTTDGNAKEKSLDKIANRVSNIVKKIHDGNKAAATVVITPPAPEAGKTEDVVAAADKLASDISPDVLMKLAATIMATEGGLEAVEPVLMKAAGIEAARQIMEQATVSYEHFVRSQQEYEQNVKAASVVAQKEKDAFAEFYKSASAEERKDIEKFASVHSTALDALDNDMLKQAYMQGAGDAAAMEDAGGQELPGAEGEASLEQIAQLLEAMVASGEIDEATAMQVLQELAGGAGGGAEGAPPAEGGGDPAAAAAAPMPEEEFKQATELVNKLLK